MLLSDALMNAWIFRVQRIIPFGRRFCHQVYLLLLLGYK